MRLLLLLALLAGGAWLGPQVSDGGGGPCPALERRVATLLDTEIARLPPAMATDPRLARARTLVAETMGAARGRLAEEAMRQRFPQLPDGIGCVVGWWKLRLDPDIGTILRDLLTR